MCTVLFLGSCLLYPCIQGYVPLSLKWSSVWLVLWQLSVSVLLVLDLVLIFLYGRGWVSVCLSALVFLQTNWELYWFYNVIVSVELYILYMMIYTQIWICYSNFNLSYGTQYSWNNGLLLKYNLNLSTCLKAPFWFILLDIIIQTFIFVKLLFRWM